LLFTKKKVPKKKSNNSNSLINKILKTNLKVGLDLVIFGSSNVASFVQAGR
jgi:hypothetical protein